MNVQCLIFVFMYFLCQHLDVGGEVSAHSRPGDLWRRISRSQTVELQTLTLLDVGYRRLDADQGRAVVRWANTNTCVTLKHLLHTHTVNK